MAAVRVVITPTSRDQTVVLAVAAVALQTVEMETLQTLAHHKVTTAVLVEHLAAVLTQAAVAVRARQETHTELDRLMAAVMVATELHRQSAVAASPTQAAAVEAVEEVLPHQLVVPAAVGLAVPLQHRELEPMEPLTQAAVAVALGMAAAAQLQAVTAVPVS
jgi:hypothetical protein